MSQAGIFSVSLLPPGTVVETLTGDTGPAVTPDGANNINVIGGMGITTSGSGHTLTVTSTGVFYQYVNVTFADSPYTVLITDTYVSVDSSGGPVTLLFPNSALLGEPYVVKDRTGSAAANNITVTTVGGAVDFDGSATFVMDNDYQSVSIIGNGSTYELY